MNPALEPSPDALRAGREQTEKIVGSLRALNLVLSTNTAGIQRIFDDSKVAAAMEAEAGLLRTLILGHHMELGVNVLDALCALGEASFWLGFHEGQSFVSVAPGPAPKDLITQQVLKRFYGRKF
jgi:hypothetical protein